MYLEMEKWKLVAEFPGSVCQCLKQKKAVSQVQHSLLSHLPQLCMFWYQQTMVNTEGNQLDSLSHPNSQLQHSSFTKDKLSLPLSLSFSQVVKTKAITNSYRF